MGTRRVLGAEQRASVTVKNTLSARALAQHALCNWILFEIALFSRIQRSSISNSSQNASMSKLIVGCPEGSVSPGDLLSAFFGFGRHVSGVCHFGTETCMLHQVHM